MSEEFTPIQIPNIADIAQLRCPQPPPIKWWQRPILWARLAQWRLHDLLWPPQYLAEAYCCDCGAQLTQEELAADRDMCFDCYCYHQD
jgi:hypothetical protein